MEFRNKQAKAWATAAMLLACPASTDAKSPGRDPLPPAAYKTAEEKKLAEGASLAIKDGNYSLAIIQLRNALLGDRDNGQLHAQLGFALFQNGNLVDAEHELRVAQNLGAVNPDLVPTLLQLMIVHKETKDLLQQFPDPLPKDTSKLAAVTLRARAVAFQYSGDAEAANISMQRSLAILSDTQGFLVAAEIATLQAKPAAALDFVNKALARDPRDMGALMTKAGLLRKSDRNQALALIEAVLKSHPRAVDAEMVRIEILLEAGRNDEAQKADDVVLAQYPNFAKAVYYKALMVAKQKGMAEGWRIAQSLPPTFVQSEDRIAYGVSEMAIASNNLESANTILASYVAQHPQALEARVRLGSLRLKMNIPAQALEILKPVLNTTDPGTLELIAQVYDKLGQHENSLAYLRKSNAQGNTAKDLTYQIAITDLMTGKVGQGMQEFSDAIRQRGFKMNYASSAIDMLVLESKYADARAIADMADRAAPRDPAPPLLKAKILYVQGDRAGSMAEINQSLGRDPKYAPALYARARAFADAHDYANAVADLKRASVLQPENPASYTGLAQIEQAQGHIDQAIGFFGQAIAKAPKRADIRLSLAMYQVRLKRLPQAAGTLKAALAAIPGDQKCLQLLGQIQLVLKQKGDAIATDRLLVRQNPASAPAQMQLANALAVSGDKKGVIAVLKQAVKLDSHAFQYRRVLIDQQIAAGDGAGALATAQDWAKGHPGPEGPLLVARTLIRLNRQPEAAALIAAVPADKQSFEMVRLTSQMVLAAGDKVKALGMLQSWVISHGSDFAAREAYADALALTGATASALVQYETVLRARADNPRVLNNIAYLVMDKSPDRAFDLASKAVRLAPNAPDIADTLGWIMLRKGDAKGAVPVLKRAHANAPDSGDVSYHLAAALSAVGQKADARKILQAAIAKDPKFSTAADANKLLQKL